MRPKPLIALGAATVLLAGGGTLAYRRRATRPETIKQPVLSFEQTSEHVRVTVHNPNRTWGFRDQRILILLRGTQGNIVNEYGPDGEHPPPTGMPDTGRRISCCLINELPPREDFVFTLWPSSYKLDGIEIRPRGGGPHWIRWND